MKTILTYISCLFIVCQIQAQEGKLETQLLEIPNLDFVSITQEKGADQYIIYLRQPLDHSDTTKGYFNQKVYLTHRGFDRPTVLVTAGYNVDWNRKYELSNLMNANQILVEHRYFGESMPDSLDYRYLNLEQVTADLHLLRELFDEVYPNKWVSTGISKGGVTTIFYRYFYPDDVSVSVPYVAPINRAYEEPRIYAFLKSVGTDDCRAKIKAAQLQFLERKEELLPLLRFYSKGANVSYEYVSFEGAFEYAVMEYPFSFWQWGHSCSDLPEGDWDIETLAQHFLAVSDMTFFGDDAIRHYTSHYYQSATEMGYYGYETAEFEDYLEVLPTDENPMALFFPFKMNDPFDGQLLSDLNIWLDSNAEHMIYIYGELDTWSASAVPFNDQVDSAWFMMEGKHHGNARVMYMKPSEQQRFFSTLERYLGESIQDK